MVEEITDLVVIPKKELIVGRSGDGRVLVMDEKSREELNGLRVWLPYTERLITVVSEEQFEKEFSLLREMFFRNTFNLLYYHNKNATSFWAYIGNGAQFLHFRDKIAGDVEQGILPFNYHTSLALNVGKGVRF